jgi:hypothetical protein
MAEKKGAKKTVGRARKGAVVKHIMKLSYEKKPNGAYAPVFERVDVETPTAESQ